MISLIARASNFSENTAIIAEGKSYTYLHLYKAASAIANQLLDGKEDLKEARIPFLIPPSFEYTAVQWGIWMAGGIAVPLCVLHPLPAIAYVLEDTKASLVIAHSDFLRFLQPLEEKTGINLVPLTGLFEAVSGQLPKVAPSRRAMILYTSGTTNKPKGVVTTHANIEAQITTLVNAWEWSEEDHILNILPLHHVHGIINVMSCALWSGACCEFLPSFESERVWEVISSRRLSLFMAVPTVYYKLITSWEKASPKLQQLRSEAAAKMRLMVSGSAALPVPVLEKWKEITTLTLLERYGMTEIGMGLSNSYRGERRAGHVGLPLPGVGLRLVDENNQPVSEGHPGEIQIKGPSVFKEYWKKPEATAKAFTLDGWFITGDIAMFNKGSYKILGRDSVDIIKSGGYKISALEIEDVLRKHPEVNDAAVIGIPNEEWGEIVAACVVSNTDNLDFKAVANWLKEQLPAYKIPRKYIQRNDLPRNVLGKVTKNDLKQQF